MVQRRALLTVALLSSLLPRQVSGTTVPDLTIRTSSDCSAKSPCGQCQGECDADNECEQGLSCLERHGRQPVPGCRLGGQGDLADHAYCHVTPGGAENAPQKKQQQKKKAAQRTSRKQCTGLLDSNLPVSEILREIRACGFAYISPGWLPTQYVAEAYEFAKRYDGASKDAYASNAGGGRRDVIPPLEGPFSGALPFRRMNTKFYELLLDIVADTPWHADPQKGRQHSDRGANCCDLFLLEVKYAVPHDAEQLRKDALPDYSFMHMTPQGEERMSVQPWHRDHVSTYGHYYMFVALHNISSGTVAAIPNSQPGTYVDDIGCGSPLNRLDEDDPRKIEGNKRCDSLGYAPDFTVPAGSIFVHEASLTHKGLPNQMDRTRYFMRYDIGPRKSTSQSMRWRWHQQGENGRLNRKRAQQLDKQIRKVRRNRREAAAKVEL